MSRPFDEARYKGLLEGLEVAVVRKSQLGEYLRVDSEFYQKQYLVLDEILRTALPLANFISYLTDGTHVTPKYQENGVNFLSSGNVSEFDVDFENVRYIGEDEHKRLSHCQPQAGDVLISKSGRIGHAAVVPDNVTKGEFNIYEGIALLRTIEIAPLTLAAIINSTVVQSQINRRFKGVAQPHLHLEDIRRLRIPHLSKSLSDAISDRVNRGRNLTSYSLALLKDAERLLNKSTRASPNIQPPFCFYLIAASQSDLNRAALLCKKKMDCETTNGHIEHMARTLMKDAHRGLNR